jgi:CTP:molybdopterin cytidylyltransferase MocA
MDSLPMTSPNATQRPRVGAVLLAAGSASRMGLMPKCLLQLEGLSLIRRQIDAFHSAGAVEVVVVLGHYANEIETAIQGLDVRVVRNPHPEEGQASSLRMGLAAWPEKASISMDAYCIGLADQPLVGAHEITDLMQAHVHRPAGCEFTQPIVEGLPGNPVMFSDSVRQDLLAASGESGGRQWQQAHPTQVYRWGTPNAHYRIDLDSPEDIRAFTLRTGRELLWPPSAKVD